jgi:hypothetical protein
MVYWLDDNPVRPKGNDHAVRARGDGNNQSEAEEVIGSFQVAMGLGKFN